jgi:hypothetical protein
VIRSLSRALGRATAAGVGSLDDAGTVAPAMQREASPGTSAPPSRSRRPHSAAARAGLGWTTHPTWVQRAPTSTPWTMHGCLVIRCALLGTAAVPHASPPAVTRWEYLVPAPQWTPRSGGRGCRVARLDHPDDPTGSYWIRPDRRPLQREQARSVWSRPDRRRAPGYGSGGLAYPTSLTLAFL